MIVLIKNEYSITNNVFFIIYPQLENKQDKPNL